MSPEVKELKEDREVLQELSRIKQPKGRKFIILQEGLIFAVLYITACAIKPDLLKLMPFAMVIIGLVPAYITGNVVKSMKETK